MMKNLILIAHFFILSLVSYSQGFIKSYKSVFSLLQPDGQGGYVTSTIYHNQANSYFVRFNSHGDSISSNSVAPLRYNAQDIIKTSDNGYLLVGYQSLVKLNSNGDVLWSNTFTLNGDLFEDAHGDYLFYDGSLIKYSQSGTLLWNKTYSYLSVGGIQSYSAGYIVAGTKNSDLILAKCNYSGDTIATRKYAVTNPGVKGVIKLLDGNYIAIVSGSKVIKFNANLDTIWSKNVPTDNYSIKSNSQSGIDHIMLADNNNVIMYDANMAQVWTYKCPDYILGFTPLSDGSAIVACSTFVNSNNTDVIKIDNRGKVYSNSIKGKVSVDANNNCQFDAGESVLRNFVLKITPGPYQYTLTDANGDYEFPIDTGITYTVTPILTVDSFYYNNCTKSYSEIVHQKGVDVINKDFVLNTFQCPVIDVIYYGGTNVRCFDGTSRIRCYNKGSLIAQNVMVKLELPNEVAFKSTTASYTKVGNVYEFAVGDINPSRYTEIQLIDSISCNTGLGDVYYVRATASTTSTCLRSDYVADTCVYRNIVSGSYDPNDKSVFPSVINIQDHNTGTKEVQYRINFQNIGTAAARDVRIIDTLSNSLNIETIASITTSHNATMEIVNTSNNVVVWRFKNINLPAEMADEEGSHGFVSFTILLTDDLVDGSVISNKAYIYFDYNDPIITNDATVSIVSTSPTESFVPSAVTNIFNPTNSKYSVSVVPNPISDGAEVSISPLLKEYVLTLYNSFGVEIESIQVSNGNGYFNRKNLVAGVYFYSVTSAGRQVGSGKIMIR